MTPRDKHIVRESFHTVRELAGPIALLFYGRLFEVEPSLRPMFHNDIALQGVKLMSMLSAVVDNLDQFETLTPVLHAMGQRHTAYGVLPRHYDTVEQALIWALGHALAPDFDPEVKAAWRNVIGTVSAAMKEGAALLPPARG